MNDKKRHHLDLRKPVPAQVLDNQAPSTGKHLFVEIDGLLHSYDHDDDLFISHRLANRMRAEIGWFEKITKHGPSVGDFYEALTRTAMQDRLPSNLRIGTGFVYDPMTRQVSSQIDILVYSAEKHPPIYQRGDFVVVSTDDVLSCVEVKKTLTSRNLRSVISATIGLNLGTSPLSVSGVQFLNIFAFSSSISIKSVEEIIATEIQMFLNKFRLETVSGHEVKMNLAHIVLPRVFFFDRTGYVVAHCRPSEDWSCEIGVDVCRSSLEGHSLGEFLVSALAQGSSEQSLDERNFLTFPLVMPESQKVLAKNVRIYVEVSMDRLASMFPKDVNRIRGKTVRGRRPYAALISSVATSANQNGSLANLERTKGLIWLSTGVRFPLNN